VATIALSIPPTLSGFRAATPHAPRYNGCLVAFLQRLGVAAVSLVALGLAIVCVVSWIPIWPCSLLEHFRVQYVACGVLVVAGGAALRLRGYTDLAVIATLVSALPVIPDVTRTARPLPPNGVHIRVLSLNVHTESTSHDEVRRLIVDEHPDVIALVEVDQRWLTQLAPALTSYTGRIEAPRPDNFGIALYARGDVTGSIGELATPLPTITASVGVAGTHFDAIVTHPIPPMSSADVERQRRQLDLIAARARTADPVIVMGDFNATPWSRPFRRFVDRSGLCDSRAGYGIQASFPAMSAVLRIPIDHVLVSCSIGVRDRRIGRDVGSDHLPVIVDLVLPR
jgi:endonuclease/exonuclease/phosphatase (EEP) superfamily protein YafD